MRFDRSIPSLLYRFDDLWPPVPLEHHPYFLDASAAHKLNARAVDFTWANAWWFAEAALASYLSGPLAKQVFAQSGFDCSPIFSVDSFQAYLVHDDEMIAIAFRGTEARGNIFERFKDWGNNFDASKNSFAEIEGQVHQGFARGAIKLHALIKPTVASLIAAKPRPLWLCGHSQGGALAIIAGKLFEQVQGVYTYGAPRVGDSAFASHYQPKLWRLVYDDDPVPLVPLEAMGFEHVGKAVFIEENGQAYFDAPPNPVRIGNPIEHAPVSYCNLAWHLAGTGCSL